MTIELRNIQVAFGTHQLFSIPHLMIPFGSRIGLVGDNGSGKSTLFSIIQGTQIPNQGEVIGTEQVALIAQLMDDQSTLSGGEQMKKKIQVALKDPKGIILADEPTTHLDKEGIRFLEKKLQEHKGTVLIISHDRSFLNRMVEKIIEIQNGKVTLYEGNYELYEKQKKLRCLEEKRQYEKFLLEKQRVEKTMELVQQKSLRTKKTPTRMGNSEARLHKMGNQRAKQNLDDKVKNLEVRLKKLEVVDKPKGKKALVIPFQSSKRIHRPIIFEAEDYRVEVNGRTLLNNASFKLFTGSKTVLTGKNGTGKTTLFKQILSKSEAINYSNGVVFGYFSQSFEQLKDSETILESVKNVAMCNEQEIRDLLAHMQFRKEEVNKKIAVLSGGERSKVAICQLLLGKCNVLLLDEPTSYLDIESIKVLEEALVVYKGTILFISHDESFIEHVATEKWELDGQKIKNNTYFIRSMDDEQNYQAKLILENRKTYLIAELMRATGPDKEQLEREFQEVVAQLRERN